jgi:hypothetical protein
MVVVGDGVSLVLTIMISMKTSTLKGGSSALPAPPFTPPVTCLELNSWMTSGTTTTPRRSGSADTSSYTQSTRHQHHRSDDRSSESCVRGKGTGITGQATTQRLRWKMGEFERETSTAGALCTDGVGCTAVSII